MSLSDRTDRVIDRIRASRSARSERDHVVQDRARGAHERAQKTLAESVAHWEHKRTEVRRKLRAIEERREHRAQRLAGLVDETKSTQSPTKTRAPERRHTATHQAAEVREAKERAARAVERVKEARHTTYRKGSGKK